MSLLTQYYAILGLTPGASPAAVKQAYRELAKQWHPDRHRDDPDRHQQAEAKLKAINEAYDYLKQHPASEPARSPNAQSATAQGRSTQGSATVASKTTNADFWYERGSANAQRGDYKEALEDLRMCIRLDPKHAAAYRQRAFVNSMLGFELGASEDLLHANRLDREQQREQEQAARTPPPRSAPSAPPPPSAPAPPSPPQPAPTPQLWTPYPLPASSQGEIAGMVISRDGKFLVTGNHDSTLQFWSTKTGQVFHTLTPKTTAITAIALSPDGQLLATASGHQITLWDLKQGTVLRQLSGQHTDTIHALAFSHNHPVLVSGGQDGTVQFWELKSSRPLMQQRHDSPIWAVGVSPDAQIALSAGKERVVTVYQVRTGEVLRSRVGHSTPLYSLAIQPTGQLFATGGANGSIALWDAHALSSGSCTHLWAAHNAPVRSLSFSPDGQFFASGAADGSLGFWTATAGLQLDRPQVTPQAIASLVFDPKGQALYVASGDRLYRYQRDR